MRPYLVVIFHVRQQYMTEASLAEHNNVVKALPSDRTDQPFGISVLPWGAPRSGTACSESILLKELPTPSDSSASPPSGMSPNLSSNWSFSDPAASSASLAASSSPQR